MANPLSGRVPMEFTGREGFHSPDTARRSRAVLPSYASSELTVVRSELVTVTIGFGALTSGTGSTVSATQYFAGLTSLQLAAYDLAQILFANVSLSAPATAIAGHPTIQLVTGQGNPAQGQLTSGMAYTKLGVKATVTLYAMSATSAGSVIVTATALVIGGALSGQ